MLLLFTMDYLFETWRIGKPSLKRFCGQKSNVAESELSSKLPGRKKDLRAIITRNNDETMVLVNRLAKISMHESDNRSCLRVGDSIVVEEAKPFDG